MLRYLNGYGGANVAEKWILAVSRDYSHSVTLSPEVEVVQWTPKA